MDLRHLFLTLAFGLLVAAAPVVDGDSAPQSVVIVDNNAAASGATFFTSAQEANVPIPSSIQPPASTLDGNISLPVNDAVSDEIVYITKLFFLPNKQGNFWGLTEDFLNTCLNWPWETPEQAPSSIEQLWGRYPYRCYHFELPDCQTHIQKDPPDNTYGYMSPLPPPHIWVLNDLGDFEIPWRVKPHRGWDNVIRSTRCLKLPQWI